MNGNLDSFGPHFVGRDSINSGFILNVTWRPLLVALRENWIEARHVSGGIDGIVPMIKAELEELIYEKKAELHRRLTKWADDRRRRREKKEELKKSALEVFAIEREILKKQFAEVLTADEVSWIVSKMPVTILKTPTYSSISEYMEEIMPWLSKRQIWKIREEILRIYQS